MNIENIPQTEFIKNFFYVCRKKYILADILKKRKHQASLGEERARQLKEKMN